jgi:hypothetical protein
MLITKILPHGSDIPYISLPISYIFLIPMKNKNRHGVSCGGFVEGERRES